MKPASPRNNDEWDVYEEDEFYPDDDPDSPDFRGKGPGLKKFKKAERTRRGDRDNQNRRKNRERQRRPQYIDPDSV